MKKNSKKRLLSGYLLCLAGIGCAVLLGVGITTAGDETRAISYGAAQTMLSARPESGGVRLRAGSVDLLFEGGTLRQWAESLRYVQFLLPAPLADAVWFARETAGLVRAVGQGM